MAERPHFKSFPSRQIQIEFHLGRIRTIRRAESNEKLINLWPQTGVEHFSLTRIRF